MTMLSLEHGTYLGDISKSISDNYVAVALTSYSDAARQKEMHYHENPHISFVLSGGNLEKRKNGENERLPGKISYYHSGEYHQSTIIANPSKHINLELYPLFFYEYGIEESALSKQLTSTPDAKFLLLKIHNELAVRDEMTAISIRMLLLELLDRSQHFQAKQAGYLWLNTVGELLRGNLAQQLSLTYLSAILDMHPVTISRQFHNSYSCTLGEYIRKLRVEKALDLIKSSQYSLTEIAFECGFTDQSHFIRTFKQLTGILPRAYQKI